MKGSKMSQDYSPVWSFSLITGLFFPYKPAVGIDKSGCPVTSNESTPESHPFYSFKVNLGSCQVYTPFVHIMSRVKIICFPIQPTHSIIASKAIHLPHRAKLSFWRLWFEQHIPALIQGAAGLQSSTPSRNKSILLWMKSNINIMFFFPTQWNNESLF